MTPATDPAARLPAEPTVEAIALLDRATALRHGVLPAHLRGGTLYVYSHQPRNLRALDALGNFTGHKVEPIPAPFVAISDGINRYYPDAGNGLVIEEESAPPTTAREAQSEEGDDASDSVAVQNINAIISRALQLGASDIHIETTEHDIVIRYRVDGKLLNHAKLPRRMSQSLVARVKVMANMDIADRRRPQDGRIAFRNGGHDGDMRVSSIPGIYGERIVMRLLQKADSLVEIEELGFSPENLAAFESLIHKAYGMILITGPTGSGKSFTLFSALKRLANPDINILTIEDPVEYELPGINQSQLNERADFSFAEALRAFLRQDPDIIMVGEIRDAETARTAVEAALTGHLVFATLHTNDAPTVPNRLVKMGIEPYNVAACLLGVIAQRLVRKVCTHCSQEREPDPLTLKRLELDLPPGTTLKYGRGCQHCNGTGYRGRLSIHELMTIGPAIEDALAAGVPASSLRDTALASGMKSLRDDGVRKALAGLTTLEEVLASTLS
jgi:type IV pilus assembly protein PilB